MPSPKVQSRPSCDEESPLIHSSRPNFTGTHSLVHQTHSPRIIIFLLTTIVFIIGFGGYLAWIPSMRIYEDVLCRRYYEELQGQGGIGLSSKIDEARCKGDKVQEELNILTAVLETLKSLPGKEELGMFMAVPYGLLADKIGRKPVFALAILGILLSLLFEVFIMTEWMMLPIRVVWFAPFLQFIGGGEKTAAAIFYAIISDVTTQSERANVFLFGACASLSAELIAPSVAAAIMAHSPWISICCGVSVLTSGLCLIVFIPETLHLQASHISTLVPDISSSQYLSDSSSDFNEPLKQKPTLTRHLTNFYTTSRPLLTIPVLLLLLPSITRVIGQQSIELCIRYISTRFSIPLSHAALILSLRALINILLLLLLIPSLSSLLITKLSFSTTHKDLLLARISSLFLILGALTIAISPSLHLTIFGLIIYTLGTGFVSLVRSLITGLVQQKYVARIFALIAVVETSSALTAGPAVAGMYELGLLWRGRWDGWLGLPFVGLAGVCGVGSLGVWCVRGLGEGVKDGVERDEDL